MALASYSVRIRVAFAELNALYASLDFSNKIREGILMLETITRTSRAGTIDRVINSLGCQVATVHRIYDDSGSVVKVFPESIVVGEVMLWRLGHGPYP
jgi:hypothetical protein